MIIKSEGDKVKHCTAPARDRKYVIAAFVNLLCSKSNNFLEDSAKNTASSLIELAAKHSSATGGGFKMAS